jgi:hypothetical protein
MIKIQDEEASNHDFLFALVVSPLFPLHQFGGFTALSYTCTAFEGSIAVLVLADFATKLACIMDSWSWIQLNWPNLGRPSDQKSALFLGRKMSSASICSRFRHTSTIETGCAHRKCFVRCLDLVKLSYHHTLVENRISCRALSLFCKPHAMCLGQFSCKN